MPERTLARIWRDAHPAVMGIVNATPDSFSDGGRFATPGAAAAHALAMFDSGADVVDVGGESTRPGSAGVDEETERARVLPVLAEVLRQRPSALLSVDTSKARVAQAALAAGAVLVNDVSAGRDPAMFETVARRGAGIVLMHMRGEPRTMQRHTAYADVVAEVHEYLGRRAAAAVAAGVAPGLVMLDPGIGFGKDDEGNLRLLAALGDLAALGHPVVVGASRKSFIGRIAHEDDPSSRLPGSLAAITGALRVPRAMVRVHDVAETVQFLAVLRALAGAA